MRKRFFGRCLLTAGIGGITSLALSATPPAGAPAPVAATAEQSSNATPAAPGGDEHWAFLKQYCSKCHNAEDWAGGVAFETMMPDGIPDDAKIWEHAMVKLRGRLMPPPGNPQPDKVAVRSFVSWMEGTLDQAAEHREDPGRVALHRLNRKEYAHAVWELLGVKVDGAALLPQDDQSGDFDNIANVLQVSPAFVDSYITAARTVAVQAMGDPTAKPIGTQYAVKGAGNQEFHVDGLPLGTRGGMAVEHDFPADGEYELNIGNMAVALWVYNLEFQHTLIATLDGKKFFETKIGGEEDMKSIDQKQDPAVDAINQRLKRIHFKATAGPHQVAVTFIHRTFAESDDRFISQVPGGVQDRVLRIPSFEIKGPLSVTGVSETPSRQRILVCHPQSQAEEQPCAQRIIGTLAERAYRRPLTDKDLQPLMKMFAAGRQGGNFDSGIRRAITAILASPYFLYRSESTPPVRQVADVKGGAYRLNDYELASRLSFFLWSTLPDQQLLNLAEQNRLHDPQVLREQVQRMLTDPRSETLASNFAYQWLNVGRLDEIKPDPNIFPYVMDPREDFKTEIRLFVDSIFREDHSVVDLLTANYTYLNERLALLYGINDVKGDRFRRVQLSDSHRFGLLGKGAVLMGTSYPNRTAPVLRGEWILARISGTPPTAPPPAVPSLKENKSGEQAHTVRELMAEHRNKPSCFACHGILDPLGLALENFDAVGTWRDKDRIAGTPIDASGVLPDGTKVSGVDDLRRTLASNPEQFVQTLTEKLMTYGMCRALEYTDMPTVRAIVRVTAKDNYRFSALVMNIVTSEQFQMRSMPAAEAPAIKQASLTK
jgi:Protein of unknown function (DUF1592)/Protein of unknown function (DUF1588)/Protein of unknown function (DUF1585)/Protein of unknown function (DUF1595)/Protein of unknown function (DUF1587)